MGTPPRLHMCFDDGTQSANEFATRCDTNLSHGGVDAATALWHRGRTSGEDVRRRRKTSPSSQTMGAMWRDWRARVIPPERDHVRSA